MGSAAPFQSRLKLLLIAVALLIGLSILAGWAVEYLWFDALGYVDAEINMFGWHTHWMIAFFLLSILFAFLLRKPLGVQN